MGGGKGVVDGTSVLIAIIAYVCYVLVGFAIFGLGITYYTQIEDSEQCTSSAALACPPSYVSCEWLIARCDCLVAQRSQ